ncbi:MAG: hypothetical protein K2H67_05380, partial [Treponemataceae bacterium]|nr:hypothetical protein [Treponemataceae bacterium]
QNKERELRVFPKTRSSLFKTRRVLANFSNMRSRFSKKLTASTKKSRDLSAASVVKFNGNTADSAALRGR